jgi:hypothetical protein
MLLQKLLRIGSNAVHAARTINRLWAYGKSASAVLLLH